MGLVASPDSVLLPNSRQKQVKLVCQSGDLVFCQEIHGLFDFFWPTYSGLSAERLLG